MTQISGIGVDLVSVERFASMSQRALDRLFSPEEQEYCRSYKNSAERFAGRYAAKEALSKALGKGIREEVRFLDMIVHASESGAPVFELRKEMLEKYGNFKLHLSISHDAGMAIAYVTVEKP